MSLLEALRDAATHFLPRPSPPEVRSAARPSIAVIPCSSTHAKVWLRAQQEAEVRVRGWPIEECRVVVAREPHSACATSFDYVVFLDDWSSVRTAAACNRLIDAVIPGVRDMNNVIYGESAFAERFS